MTRVHKKTQKRTKSEIKHMWKSHSEDWKSYISTCMLTMHPLNILNMWPIIFNKLIVAGAEPVHSCKCNRLLSDNPSKYWQILTMSSSSVIQCIQSPLPDRPRSPTYLVCWHVSRFRRSLYLIELPPWKFYSIVQPNTMHRHVSMTHV